jgi:sugar lactone lactonase YvrE
VTFYIDTTVFGERLMKVGEALSDATGTSSLLYRPTWDGDHMAVARFSGTGNLNSTETTFHFDAQGVESPFEPADFGLDPVRAWLPVAVGLLVLVVLSVLGFAMVSTVVGIRAATSGVPVVQPLPPWDSRVQHPSPLKWSLVALAVLFVAAAYPAWRLIGESQPPVEQTFSVPTAHAHPPSPIAGAAVPLPATLVSVVQTATFDEGGQPAPGSVTIPTDVAINEGRIRVLDSSRGRIVTVAKDGTLATIFDGSQYGETSLKGAETMVAVGDQLYVAMPQGGQVLVLGSSGKIENIVRSVIPAGQAPVTAAGIAVNKSGEIWMSDSANHRVILLNSNGEFQRIIGVGAPSTSSEGFDTPGGLTIDDDGNLYVADTGNKVVKKFSPTGVFLESIGDGALDVPTSVAVNSRGQVFVADETAHLVTVFGPDGSYIGSISETRLSDPHRLTIDGDTLYVVDRLAGLFVFQVPEADASAQ